MQQSLAIPFPAYDDVSEPEHLDQRDDRLRTATGFVVGIALSGALWMVAGLMTWCLA